MAVRTIEYRSLASKLIFVITHHLVLESGVTNTAVTEEPVGKVNLMPPWPIELRDRCPCPDRSAVALIGVAVMVRRSTYETSPLALRRERPRNRQAMNPNALRDNAQAYEDAQ